MLRRWSTRWSSQGEAGEPAYPTPTLQSHRQTALRPVVNRRFTYPTADRETALAPEVNLRFTYPTADRQTALGPEVNLRFTTYPRAGLPFSRLTLHLPCTWPSDANRARVPRPTLHLPYRPPAGRTRPCPPTYPTPTL